jgi:hypothetical protein
LLVVEDPGDASFRWRYDRPFLPTRDGREVLLGWVCLEEYELARYVRRAVALLRRRPAAPDPLVLLAPRERCYLDLLEELEEVAQPANNLKVFRWSAERICREKLVEALRLGASALLYAGHGDYSGWFAYGGLTAEILSSGPEWTEDETNALMFSLSSRAAQPCAPMASSSARVGFAYTVVSYGVAGAVLAPVFETAHADSLLLARTLVLSLRSGHHRMGDILRAARDQGASLRGYAVVGDPALGAVASGGAVSRGERVFATAVDPDLSLPIGAGVDQYAQAQPLPRPIHQEI